MNSAGLVAGKKQFQELKVEGDWFADVLDVTGLINDVDLSLWPSDTIMKNGTFASFFPFVFFFLICAFK